MGITDILSDTSMNKERLLVVAAHPDDESFGCLGTLLQVSRTSICFAWFTNAPHDTGGVSRRMVTEFFEAEAYYFGYEDQRLDTSPLVDLIADVEAVVKDFKPTVAYIPFIADLNSDHRRVSEACMVAMRPYKPFSPRDVWMYSIPGTSEIGLRPMKVDRMVEIDKKRKRNLIGTWYPTELKNGRETIDQFEYFERWPSEIKRSYPWPV